MSLIDIIPSEYQLEIILLNLFFPQDIGSGFGLEGGTEGWTNVLFIFILPTLSIIYLCYYECL